MPSSLAWATTFLFVVVGWVVFRSPSFEVAGTMLQRMSGLDGFDGTLQRPLLIIVAGAVSLLGPTSYEVVTRYLVPNRPAAVLTATALMVVLFEVGTGQPISFIYFQF